MLSHLTNKSEINKAAAELLQEKSYYPSVVHCAYYSCIQLMKHILLFTLNKTETEIANEVRNSGEGLHEIMINTINGQLRSNNKNWKTFNSSINQLKRLRVNADYENIQIDSTIGNNSLLLSDTVLKHLKANIKL
jgi:hypothetical protein